MANRVFIITDEMIAAFRSYFPEFSSTEKYPTNIIRTFMDRADRKTGSRGWGKFELDPTKDTALKRMGMWFYTGHLLAYTYGVNGATDPTSVYPGARLNTAEEHVGDEGKSYRVTQMENTRNDALSTTIYGIEFVTLRAQVTNRVIAI